MQFVEAGWLFVEVPLGQSIHFVSLLFGYIVPAGQITQLKFGKSTDVGIRVGYGTGTEVVGYGTGTEVGETH